MKILPSFVMLVLLASCVQPPRTLGEAVASRDGNYKRFPMCSSSGSSPLAGYFTKPARDMGNGTVAVVTERFAEGPTVREALVIDCSTGLGVQFREGGGDYTDPEPPIPLFSDDLEFRSPVERFLDTYASSRKFTDVIAFADQAKAEGHKPSPWIEWHEAGKVNDAECACDLYFRDVKRVWFDKDKVGNGYPEALGLHPSTFAELKQRMSALKATE